MSELQTRDIAQPYGFPGLIGSLIVIIIMAILISMVAYFAVIWLSGSGWMEASIKSASRVDIKDMRSAPLAQQMFFYGLIGSFFIVMLLPVLAAALWRGGNNWLALLAWRRPVWPFNRLWLIVLVLAMPVYLLGAGYSIKLVDPSFRTWFFVPNSAQGMILSFAVVVIAAPLAEELLFRGWIYTSLKSSLGWLAALLLTMLLFALAHTDGGWLYPAAIILPGLFLGLMREWTGSTIASFSTHATYNAIAWVIVLLESKKLLG